MINAGVPLPRRSKRGADTGADESGEEVDGPPKKIKVDEGVRFECKELMGIFWPTQVYEEHFGRKLGKRAQNVDVGGMKRKGIVLGTDCDKVAGCVEINRVSFSEGSRSSEVHDSSTSLRQGEHEEHWKLLQKSFGAATRKRKEAEGETHQSYSVTKGDFFDELWGPVEKPSAESKQDAPTQAPKKKSRKSAGPPAQQQEHQQQRQDKPRGAAGDKNKMSEKARNNAFATSEQVRALVCP